MKSMCLLKEIRNTALILIMYANDPFLSNDSAGASFTSYVLLSMTIHTVVEKK